MLRWNLRNILALSMLGLALMFLAAATVGAASGAGKSVSPRQPAVRDRAEGGIRASVPLTTPTPIRTWTPTPTPTVACCIQVFGGIPTPTCNYITQTGQFNINFWTDLLNLCPVPIPANLTGFLEVSTDGINWVPQAQNSPVAITIPAGPPSHAWQSLFYNQPIPPQYPYFRAGAHIIQGGNCQVTTFYSSTTLLCRPLVTPTGTPPTATPTPACCTNLPGSVLTPSCSYNSQTGQFSFGSYVEVTNQCGQAVQGTMTDALQVSTDGALWLQIASSGPLTVTIPPGPPPYARFFSFSNQTIAPQYQYFRLESRFAQGGTCQVYYYTSSTRSLCWPVVTPSVTPTGTPPTPTGTPFVLCDIFNGPAVTSCPEPDTYSYNFGFYVYCNTPLTGIGNLYFEVAPGTAGPWTIHDQRGWAHTFPPGSPGGTSITGTFIETNIPGQYSYYRVRLTGSASNGQPLAHMTGATALCRGGTPTPTPCPIQFTDVPAGNPFYPFIRCLACRQFVSGYSDGTFRPYADVTRGQLAKIISQAAGLLGNIPSTQQTFSDVPNSNPFWVHIERMAAIGAFSGYACGGPGEPCDGQNRPYFRWGNNATRGQISKIIAVTAGWNGPIPTTQQTFADVPSTNPFWLWIEELAGRQIISGYACGGPGEPCDPQYRPYFRWGANATRGQMSKIAANAFFPNCQTPARR